MSAAEAERIWRAAFEELKASLAKGSKDGGAFGFAEIEAWHQYRAALMRQLAESIQPQQR